MNAVRLPNDPLVHIKSDFYFNETKCHLGGVQAPELIPTEEPPTCERCKRAKAA